MTLLDVKPLCDMLMEEHDLSQTERNKLKSGIDVRLKQAREQWIKDGLHDDTIEVISYVEFQPDKYFWLEMDYDPDANEFMLLEHGVINNREYEKRLKQIQNS